MVAPPRIELHIDDDLRVGEFGIAARTVNEPAETPDEVVAPPAYTPPSAGAAPGSLVDQTILYQEAAAMPAASPAAARGGTPHAVLRGPEGEWELRDAVTVLGRSRRCDIVLPDPNVSRQHAEIRRENDGFMVRDLGSTNGVRINRRDVKQAVLQHGDRLEIGTTELLFERLP